MAKATIVLPSGLAEERWELPGTWSVRHLPDPPPVPPLPLEETLRQALRRPMAGPALRDLAHPGMRVTVAVPDATRPCPDRVILPLILEELREAGVRTRDVTVLVALGMHRRATPTELREKTAGIGEPVRVEESQGAEPGAFVNLGTLLPFDRPEIPVPVEIHRRAVECDLLLATGVVEPHQFAGFSGGRKTVAVGCASGQAIRALHGIPFLEHPGTRLGALRGNRLHLTLEVIGRMAGLAFVVNVALDAGGRLIGAAAGTPKEVLEDLIRRLEPQVWAPVESPVDAVLAGVGGAKGANLYQASRAFTYLALAPEPVVRDGGWIVLAAPCPEGVGQGPGEAAFRQAMEAAPDPAGVLERLRERGIDAGGQRAFLVAGAQTRFRGMIVGCQDPALATACHFAASPDGAAAVERLLEELGPDARILVVPHPLLRIPRPAPGAGSTRAAGGW